MIFNVGGTQLSTAGDVDLRTLGIQKLPPEVTEIGGSLWAGPGFRDLNNLKRVGDSLYLTDAQVLDLGKVEFVGKNIYMPGKPFALITAAVGGTIYDTNLKPYSCENMVVFRRDEPEDMRGAIRTAARGAAESHRRTWEQLEYLWKRNLCDPHTLPETWACPLQKLPRPSSGFFKRGASYSQKNL